MFIPLVCPQYLRAKRCQTEAINIQSRTPTVYRCQTRAINIQLRTYSQMLLVSNESYKYSIFDRHFRTPFPKPLPTTACRRHPTSRRFSNEFEQTRQSFYSVQSTEEDQSADASCVFMSHVRMSNRSIVSDLEIESDSERPSRANFWLHCATFPRRPGT
jgi:hypothetical protein